MSRSLFLLSTASQAFFLNRTPWLVNKSILIITVKRKKEAEKIFNHVQNLEWKKIYIWYVPGTQSKWEYYKLLTIKVKMVLFRINYPDFDRIYMGSYLNLIHLSLSAQYEEKGKGYLLYDGLQMMSVHSLRSETPSGGIPKYPPLYELLGFKKPQLRSLTFVSPLPLEASGLDDIELIKNPDSGAVKTTKTKVVYIVGQPLTSIGIVSEDFYLSCLKRIKSRYNDYDINYFAHPRESEEILQKIKRIIAVKKLSKLFEEYYLGLKILPEVIISFYSSVLVNLIFFNSDSMLIAIEIPSDELLNEEHKTSILHIYNYFHTISRENFKVIPAEGCL